MFLIGLLIAFCSVFVPCLITGLVKNNEKTGLIIGFGGIIGVAYGLLVGFISWSAAIGTYGPLPYFGYIFLGLLFATLVGWSNEAGRIPTIFVIIAVAVWIFVSVSGSDMLHAPEKARLIGEITPINEISSAIKPVDNLHINQVSREIATTNVQRALSEFKLKDGAIAGSRYNIGSPTKQLVDGHLWWVFPLRFQGYFQWKRDPQIPGYLRVSAENPSEPAQAVQYDGNKNEIHMKYVPSASFGNQAIRYLRNNGYMSKILIDWTFEVNDNWEPFYTISVVKRTMGYTGLVTEGVLVLNPQDGDIKYYPIKEVPAWIDRVVPLEIIDTNCKKWGMYLKNTWKEVNLIRRTDKCQEPTPGWYLVYNEGRCYWFSGFTSVNASDQALTGFVLVDARTGITKFYNATGVTETLASNTASTMWNNFPGYMPTELIPHNIYGLLTYVVPMQCNNQLSGISLVALGNINIKGFGKDLPEALRNYRDSIANAGQTGLAPDSQVKLVQVKGKIERIGLPLVGSKTTIFTFKLLNVDKLFQVNYSDANPKPIMMSVGDEVVIAYYETTEAVVQVKDFDIPAIKLTAGSITQAKYITEQKKFKGEIDSVEKQKETEKLLESDRLKNTDPNALKEFLDQQEKKNKNP